MPSRTALPLSFVLRPLALVLLGGAAAIGAAPSRAADAAPTPVAATARYEIPAGELGPALSSFATQAGVLFAVDPVLTRGKRTRGLSGAHSVEGGFARLLAGTGLQVEVRTDGSYGLRSAEDLSDAEEVIVIARRPTSVGKLDVPLKDQPQNVSVVTRSRLDEFGKARIDDVAYATVGLQPVARQQGATSYGFFLRGFNGAPILTDGYYSSNNAFGSVGIIDMATVESVEVLRGPASLLYGQGNPGGVVNVTSKAPRSEFGAGSALFFDDFGGQRFEGDVTGRLVDGIDGRLVGVVEDSDTFRRQINQKRYLFSPQVAIQARDDLRIRLQYTYDDFRYVPDNGPGVNDDLIRHLPVRRSVQEPGLGHIRQVNEQARVEADWKFAERWTFRAGAFGHKLTPHGRAEEIDPDATIEDTTIGRVFITTIEPDDNGADDYMLTGQFLGRFETGILEHNVTLAYDRIRNRSKYDYAYYAFSPIDYADPDYTDGPVEPDPDDLLFSGQGAFTTQIRAHYLQDLIAIGEHWKLLLGVRQDDIEIIGYADPDRDVVASRDRADKVTPRAGLVYSVTPALTLYGSYSESFVPNYGNSFSGDPFKPEESRSYEVGFRQQFDNDLLLTAAAYDIEKKNILVVDPVNDDFNINAGVARSQGVEAELQGRLATDWRLSLGAAYNDARITRSVDENFFPEGDTLPAAAHWSLLANTHYDLRSGVLAGLGFGANAAYTSARPYRLPNVERDLPSFVRLDLFASYELTRALDLQVNLNNLTDERILLANGYGRVQFDSPRAVSLVVRYRMGSLGR